jgi:N-acetylornithine carbamoyltransferase
MRHFYSLNEFTLDQIQEFLDRAVYHKRNPAGDSLSGKQFGLLFLDPSLRTRCSFEVAARQLGGGVTTLEGQTLWKLETRAGTTMDQDRSEHVKEAMGVLSRYFDCLGLRCFARGEDREEDLLDQTFAAFLEYAKIPVVNMESAVYHPCQAMADLMTIRELFPDGFKRRKILVTWAPHPKRLPTAVTNSIVLATTLAGMDVTVAHPEGFDLQEGIIGMARGFAKSSGGSVRVTHDREDAAIDVDVVYAKAWGGLSAYEDAEAESKLRASYSEWRVDQALMDRTKRASFMHCLPVRRNVVVTDAVMDSKQSVVFRQAENRLHVQKAILEWVKS